MRSSDFKCGRCGFELSERDCPMCSERVARVVQEQRDDVADLEMELAELRSGRWKAEFERNRMDEQNNGLRDENTRLRARVALLERQLAAALPARPAASPSSVDSSTLLLSPAQNPAPEAASTSPPTTEKPPAAEKKPRTLEVD